MEPTDPQAAFNRSLAYIDRRALSQAWYARLHAGQPAPGAPRMVRGVRQAQAASFAHGLVRAAVTPNAQRFACTPSARVSRADTRAHVAAAAARFGKELARADRRTPRPAAQTAVSSAFTIGFGDSRLHVRMNRRRGELDLVVLCAQRHAAAVTNVLARLQTMLRNDGERLRASVIGLGNGR